MNWSWIYYFFFPTLRDLTFLFLDISLIVRLAALCCAFFPPLAKTELSP